MYSDLRRKYIIDGVNVQKVEIFYNVIGKFDPPPIFDSEENQAND